MINMFNAFISVTLWSSLIIVAVLIIRNLLSHKLSARAFKAIWLCLAIRLILPFDFSIENAPISVPLPSQIYMQASIPQISAVPDEGNVKPNNYANTHLPNASVSLSALRFKATLPFIWLTGAVMFLLSSLFAYLLFVNRLRNSRQAASEDFKQICGKLKVYYSNTITSPLLCGYFRPAIYLPYKKYTLQEQSGIMQHEMTHYKQGDLWFQLLLLCAASLSWFNPLVHIMRRMAICDIEMTVDEKMLKNADMQKRIKYGQMLFTEISSKESLLMAQYNSGKGTKQRFKSILSTSAKRRGGILLSFVVALCLSVSFMVSCAPKPASQGFQGSTSTSTAITPPPASAPQSDAGSSQSDEASASLTASGVSLPLADNLNVSGVHLNSENNIEYNIAAPNGAPILAVLDGKVEEASGTWVLGNYIKINHGGGFYTIYSHCSELKAEKGQTINAGEVIATVGTTGQSTGNHLGFSFQTNNDEMLYAQLLDLTADDVCDYIKDNVYSRDLTEEEINFWTNNLKAAQNLIK